MKIKCYIHSIEGLWAYARELSEREKFAAKAAGADHAVIFEVNHNPKLRTGLFVEFRGQTLCIASIDGFEFYNRDLTLRCERIKAEAADYEEYDQQ